MIVLRSILRKENDVWVDARISNIRDKDAFEIFYEKDPEEFRIMFEHLELDESSQPLMNTYSVTYLALCPDGSVAFLPMERQLSNESLAAFIMISQGTLPYSERQRQ